MVAFWGVHTNTKDILVPFIFLVMPICSLYGINTLVVYGTEIQREG